MVWQRCPSEYEGTNLVTLLKIAGLSTKSGQAKVRVHVLAAMCGVTERTMQRTLKRLKKDGLLTVKHRKNRSSILTLNNEVVLKLPLAYVNEEKEQQQTAEPAKPTAPSEAAELAQRIHDALPKLLPQASVPGDCERSSESAVF
jgi:DNA-binding transcriptional regulator YhcF (GntR family)